MRIPIHRLTGGRILSPGACGAVVLWLTGCANAPMQERESDYSVTAVRPPIADEPTEARAVDGRYISWREHIIDDPAISGVPISGSDGLTLADLDGDGFEDIVSVHESDTVYDGQPHGHVRLAFGGPNPSEWQLATLAEGVEAAAAEDAAIADMNDDGLPDIVVACELAHLIYFENPGPARARSGAWPRRIVEATRDRGSYIRVFAADFDADGRPEVVTPNKGAQNPDITSQQTFPISWFDVPDEPLTGRWREHELTRVLWPINARPVDLDGDGDPDVVGGSTGEGRIFWFENVTPLGGPIRFVEHPIRVAGSTMAEAARRPPHAAATGALLNGFNMGFADLDGDGRLDLVAMEYSRHLVWLRQPAAPDQLWRLAPIGTQLPDNLVGFELADIDGDGDLDVMGGSYSRGPRDVDGVDLPDDTPLGRISWFENPGASRAGQERWRQHTIVRRQRGMYDKFVARDVDGDGDQDFLATRGNSYPYDGVFWLEQVRHDTPRRRFAAARSQDSRSLPVPPDS